MILVNVVVRCLLEFVPLLFWTDPTPPEQIAFNYFMDEIFEERYAEYDFVVFSGKSQNEKSIDGPFYECFSYDSNFVDALRKVEAEKDDAIKIKSEKWHNQIKLTRAKSRRLNLEVYRSVRIGEVDYVYIYVYKMKAFVDNFLIKLSNNKVVDYCHFNEVI